MASGISSLSSAYTGFPATDTIQPRITFSGLGSDVDFASMIDSLVEAEGIQKQGMEAWKSQWSAKIAALETLNSKMTDFRTAVAAMKTTSQFLGKTATSSNTDVLTATASSTAISGTHQIEVNQLARNESEVHGGVEFTSTVVNNSGSAQTFAFSYAGGAAVSISVANGATLSDLVSAINSSGANPGVTASILDMGASAGLTRYRLVLQGQDGGAANTIAIDDGLTTLDGTGGTVNFESGTFTQSQAAQDAQIRVDGYPPASWIERSSNTISDVIPGVSLNLLNTTASAIQLTISDDTSSMEEKVQSMVSNYNDVVAYIIEQTKYDASTGESGILLGNYAVGIVKSALNAIGTGNAPGFDDPADTYINLGQLGITTDSDPTSPTFGQLLIDESTLTEAITTNPDAVSNLMSAYFKGVSDDATGNITYYSSIQGITLPGIYEVSATVSGGAITSATINGHAVTISGDTITGNSGYAEYGLAVKIDLSSDGAFNGQVRLQEGFNGAFDDKLTTLLNSTGPVNVVIDNYNDIISNIDEKIAFETNRLESYRQHLIARFARLDATLAELNQQSEYLSSQLKQTSS